MSTAPPRWSSSPGSARPWSGSPASRRRPGRLRQTTCTHKRSQSVQTLGHHQNNWFYMGKKICAGHSWMAWWWILQAHMSRGTFVRNQAFLNFGLILHWPLHTRFHAGQSLLTGISWISWCPALVHSETRQPCVEDICSSWKSSKKSCLFLYP